MGCKPETKLKLDYIQDFEMMFERMKLKRPREAAVYYVTLIIENPKEFSEFLKIAKNLANITRRPLETGRSCLLKEGLIAKVLFSNDSDEDFGRESYLPADPRAVWEDIKSDLKNYIAEDTFESIKNRLKKYGEHYKENFEKYGIKIKRNGNVTLQYSGKWIIYNVLSNCLKEKKNLRLQIGGERFFKEPFVNYLEKLLNLNSTVQLIVEKKADKKIAKNLKKAYGDKIDIRYFADDISGTIRKYVFGKELAVDGIKILPKSHDEPSYVGTAYVKPDDIKMLNGKFDSLWDMAKPIE